MEPQQIIRRPLITEKSTRLKESGQHDLLRGGPGAPTRSRSRKAVEKLFGVKVADVRVANRQGKLKRMGRFVGRRKRLEEGVRAAGPRREADRVLRGRLKDTMPVKKYKPTSAGAPVPDDARLRGAVTAARPGEEPDAGCARRAAATTRGGITARFLGGGHKRLYRIIDFRRDKTGHPGEGRDDRVRPEPHGAHRAAPLRRRREALHPGARRARRSARASSSGRTRGHPARQRAAAARHPARHDDPQHRAEARARAASSCARPAPAAQLMAKEGELRAGAPARRARSARSTSSATPRSARSATSSTRTSRSARPAATAGWAGGRTTAASR